MLVSEARQSYTRDDVRRMLGISGQRLRNWERQGWIPARNSFSFSDLLALKTLQKLQANRIPSKKIGLALDQLRKKIAEVEDPLTQLKISTQGRTITAQLAGQKIEAITGQILLDFEVAEAHNLKTLSKAPKTDRLAQQQQSEFWFQRGLELEERGGTDEEAAAAYKKAVDLNPKAVGALVNLGTICYHRRSYAEAEAYYLKALEADPHYSLAHFNLGNLYDDRRQVDKAREHYAAALKLNPNYADAHYNMALLCERCSDLMQATVHWKAYLKLDSSSQWAAIARGQLEKLRQVLIAGKRIPE